MSLVKYFDINYKDDRLDEVCFFIIGDGIRELYLTVDDYLKLNNSSKIKVTVEAVDV